MSGLPLRIVYTVGLGYLGHIEPKRGQPSPACFGRDDLSTYFQSATGIAGTGSLEVCWRSGGAGSFVSSARKVSIGSITSSPPRVSIAGEHGRATRRNSAPSNSDLGCSVLKRFRAPSLVRLCSTPRRPAACSLGR